MISIIYLIFHIGKCIINKSLNNQLNLAILKILRFYKINYISKNIFTFHKNLAKKGVEPLAVGL